MNTLQSWQGLQRQWFQPLYKPGNELWCFPSGVRALYRPILHRWEQRHKAVMGFPVLREEMSLEKQARLCPGWP